MQTFLYVMLIKRGKTYNKVTRAAIERHVENLRQLDQAGHLHTSGVLKRFPGVAGLVILAAKSREEAEALCQREPLVAEGYASYDLYDFQEANQDNNYLL